MSVYKKNTMLHTLVKSSGVASLMSVADDFAMTSQNRDNKAKFAPSSAVTVSAVTPSSAAITREADAKTAPCEVQRMPAPTPPTAEATVKITGTKSLSGARQQHAKP